MQRFRIWIVLLAFCLSAAAQRRISSPKEEFGHNIGDDYFLATYSQYEKYMQKLAGESDRMKLVDIGKTAEGRTQYMSIVSAPETSRTLRG